MIAYTGTCLFEGINISEGRGTDKPFEYVGAPWIDHHKAAELLNGLGLDGIRFEPVEFVPEKKPHLSREPELSGQRCRGIYVHVLDREKANPYRAGIALVWAFQTLHADKLVWDENVIERLTATKRFMKMIKAGKRPDEIFESWRDEVEQFKDMSRKYLLYR